MKFLVDYNFANVEGYPRFKFETDAEENLVDASVVLVNVAKALPDYEFDIDEVIEKFGYTLTKKEKEEPALNPAQLEPDTEGVTTH